MIEGVTARSPVRISDPTEVASVLISDLRLDALEICAVSFSFFAENWPSLGANCAAASCSASCEVLMPLPAPSDEMICAVAEVDAVDEVVAMTLRTAEAQPG